MSRPLSTWRRQAGITPRGLVDCLIAAVAKRHEAALLAATSTSTWIAWPVS
jgi:predicted nucleic acid-binding protein